MKQKTRPNEAREEIMMEVEDKAETQERERWRTEEVRERKHGGTERGEENERKGEAWQGEGWNEDGDKKKSKQQKEKGREERRNEGKAN